MFAAHLRIAWRAGRLTWHASVRDLAIEAWSGQWAARAATDRLCAAGLLERVRAADGTRASVLGLPSPCIPRHPPAPDGHGDRESGWIPREAEEGGALDGDQRAALSVLRRMGKASAVGMALALGVDDKGAAARLRALQALGLAEETRDGWRAAEGDARALAARGTARAAERERLRDQFEDERLAWRARVARGGAVALPDRLRGREEV